MLGVRKAGAFFVEVIFGIPGFGEQTYRALRAFDYPLLMGVTLVGAGSRDLAPASCMRTRLGHGRTHHRSAGSARRGPRKERPLARNKEQTRKLFDERQDIYCLADWHFVVKPDLSSLDVARQIVEEVLS